MKRRMTRVIEVKRAIDNFLNNLSEVMSRGELNSEGVKALARIIKMLNKMGMRHDAMMLTKRLRRRGDMEEILSTLSQIEEKISDRD
ncbi:MAG: hypothetical protein N3F04_04345 [Candidatus Nezhaarchaeota archaeon]|nr:hypothetical protein [Candidatus Nezhaarchaeota archaeon]MCX8141992.1 hypothetical protein [Candidatus Nezhaarchaeota archaeon]MDW8050227.1 hypothetical protein [Nitrososphaerota archaeon]